MKLFIKNNCRYCRNVFCCENCRINHEKNVHGYNSECSFCNFNTINVNIQLSNKLKNHINDIHFPFSCPFCNIILNIIDNLIEHIKYPCSKFTPHKDISKCITPMAIKNTNFETYVRKTDKYLTTSTPRNETDHEKLEDFQEYVTPVNNEAVSFFNPKKQSCLKYTPSFHDDQKITDYSMKRRVTFSNIIQDIKEYDVENIEKDHDDKNCNSNLVSFDNSKQTHAVTQETIWHTAFESNQDNEDVKTKSKERENDKVFEINFNSHLTTESISDEYPSSLIDEKQSSSSILSSVANIFKNFVGNISQNNEQIIGQRVNKRQRSEKEDAFDIKQRIKRRKYLNVQCRKNIHPLSEKYFQLVQKITCDKSTQTD